MQEDGLRAKKRRRFVMTTDSSHAHPVATNALHREFGVASPMFPLVKDGSTWPSCSTWDPALSSAGPWGPRWRAPSPRMPWRWRCSAAGQEMA
jgi:hypothetical protein